MIGNLSKNPIFVIDTASIGVRSLTNYCLFEKFALVTSISQPKMTFKWTLLDVVMFIFDPLTTRICLVTQQSFLGPVYPQP